MTNSKETQFLVKEPKCAICGNTLFKIERVSHDKIRLTCENCGEQHLIGITSATTNQSILEFYEEEKKVEIV